MKVLSRSYYFDPVKNIRDLIHGYVYLTKFELNIIDTVSFQRLKDVRQLTCQEVYPSAILFCAFRVMYLIKSPPFKNKTPISAVLSKYRG